jgi:hypothetical protein
VVLAHRLGDIRVFIRDRGLPLTHRLPELIIDDAQLRHLAGEPFALGVEARHALSGRWILDIAQPVPDQATNIEFVVDEAGSALHMAPDRGVAPWFAVWTGNTLFVQGAGDRTRANTRGEFPEDTPDDVRLPFVDLAIAADRIAACVELFDDLVAIAKPAARFALLDTATNATMGLCSEVLEEQRVHRALEPDMQLADFAFREGDDGHAGERQMFVEGGDIGLVAADPVQRFGQHHVELPGLRILEQ